ncbi:MAG: FeoA family protein [Peptococcia bacterium]|jgi:ferrous iron transport protein A
MSEKELLLASTRQGSKVVIKKIPSGTGLKTRLNEMGLNRGTEISVIRNDGWGPVLIALSGSRIALGRQMAGKIFVEKVAQ